MLKEPYYAKRLLELYAQGKTISEIAAATCTKFNTVTSQISELRRRGYDVPYRQPHRDAPPPPTVAPLPPPSSFLPPVRVLDQQGVPSLPDAPVRERPTCTYVLETVSAAGKLRTCDEPTASRRDSYCIKHAKLCLDHTPRKKLKASSFSSSRVPAGRFGGMGDYL